MPEEMLMLCVRNCSQLCSAYMYVHRHLSQLTPRSHILHALSVIVIIISLIVIKWSKANTSAKGDTDCTSKLDRYSWQNHFAHLEMIEFQDL